MSGDKEQEYFSDGLTEEVLNSLARINELQVAARTSSFSFQGEHPDIATVAHKLNVGAVLEGSVRRSAQKVRVSAQLINAVTGFHLWSHTYDRELTDVLKLQADIADAVASALKVNLLGDAATKIELGGTRNPGAFDAFLRCRAATAAVHASTELQPVIDHCSEAIKLDPNYALALANRSMLLTDYAGSVGTRSAIREAYAQANLDAMKSIALAPDLAEGHLALAYFAAASLNFESAKEAYDRAFELAPGNARVLRDHGWFDVLLGRTEAGIANARRAVVLDPLNYNDYVWLGYLLYFARRNDEALTAVQEALALKPDYWASYEIRGLAYYALGDFQRSRSSCEPIPAEVVAVCLPVTYDKLGRHADAESRLAYMVRLQGDSAAFQYAEIYTQWGKSSKALEWLETALRLRDPGLYYLKVDPLLDPLRKEPRFQAIERALNFPN